MAYSASNHYIMVDVTVGFIWFPSTQSSNWILAFQYFVKMSPPGRANSILALKNQCLHDTFICEKQEKYCIYFEIEFFTW